jgi:hypothetical protein
MPTILPNPSECCYTECDDCRDAVESVTLTLSDFENETIGDVAYKFANLNGTYGLEPTNIQQCIDTHDEFSIRLGTLEDKDDRGILIYEILNETEVRCYVWAICARVECNICGEENVPCIRVVATMRFQEFDADIFNPNHPNCGICSTFYPPLPAPWAPWESACNGGGLVSDPWEGQYCFLDQAPSARAVLG